MYDLERNFARHAVDWKLGRFRPYRPLAAYVYLTFRCSLACVYCNDGVGRKYPECPTGNELSNAEWVEVLRVLRRETDVLIITGGEPTMRSDLRRILEACRDLRFRKVCLLTNGLTLDLHPEIFELCQIVMISLDTLDPAKADRMMGAGPGTFAKILRNVELAIEARGRRRFRLCFNVVVTPENVPDVHDVIDFCLARSIGFTPLPEVLGVYPRPELKGHPGYEQLIDRMIALKRAGGDVLGSLSYLQGIRGFSKYRCLAPLLARVWPNGDLCYPCQKLHKVGGNLLSLRDYSAAVDEGRRRHGELPDCDNRCHVGCYMDFSMCVQRPELLLREAWFGVKSLFFRPASHVGRRLGSVPARARGVETSGEGAP